MKNIDKLNMPNLELSNVYVIKPTVSGPISAANFPSIL